MKREYSVSDRFILRYPFVSFRYDNGWELDDIYDCKEFTPSLWVASPVLSEELQKCKEGKIKDEKSIEKINISLYKYWSRIRSRSTPFGLFSGVSLGTIGDQDNIVFGEEVHSKIRMDMKYLYDVFVYLKNLSEVRKSSLFYINDSLHLSDNKYRFIEKKYMKDVIKYEISITDRSFVLKKILLSAKNGISYQEIVNILVAEGYDEDESLYEYIDNIIDSQILISELEPTLIGRDYLEKILKTFETRNIDHEVYRQLKQLKFLLNQLNQKSTLIEVDDIIGIEKFVESINIPFDRKFLIQIDSSRKLQSSSLSREHTHELLNTVSFLLKLGVEMRENTYLNAFKKEYQERYETEEIPLLQALDPELGIGYPATKNTGKDYSNSLIGNFVLVNPVKPQEQKKGDRIQDVIIEKIMIAKEQQQDEIVISDQDFPFLDSEKPVEKPSILNTLFEVINDPDNNQVIHLQLIGSGSGAKLMSRFSRLDQDIEEYVQQLIKTEQEQSSTELVELSHLSETPRVGNISIRPRLTQYEITCLSHSDLDQKFVIPLSDIMISIQNDKIVLKSKKLKKEILPILTTAHNYGSSSFAVYKFLCDLQQQNFLFKGIILDSSFDVNLNYIPRIRYKNTILRLASWKIVKAELTNILEEGTNRTTKRKIITQWMKERNIPRYILIAESDNEMFVDFHNDHSINVFLSILKRREKFNITEFLFNDKTAIVKDRSGNPYRNQIILPLFKNHED
ncbi:lantibiotic dehydratase family protein [Chryseobacterium sp. c4a]|uniref:lantibiotic dehydratase family protein n=1 Tax=Chryseobacterium sp. c4a TaxID=1573582 RepID=UPI001359ACDA|nr:lantibiotic dehydratase family protein [Chryseobacterium sp. c4a]